VTVILLTDLLRQKAVSLETAETTGEVKGVVVHGDRVVRVRVADGMVDAAAVRSFEGDVLTYDGGLEPMDGSNPPEVIGARVLDVRGDELGTIADIAIEADGAITELILADGQQIEGSRLTVIGSWAAIVTVELEPPTGEPVG